MQTKICPVCGKTVFATDECVDVVHQCKKEDGTNKTTQTNFGQIAGRINLKIDSSDWPHKGESPYPHKRSQSSKDDALLEETDIKTTIEF